MFERAEFVEGLKDRGHYAEDGHFLLASHKHSDSYIHVRVALMDPATGIPFATAMADEVTARGARVVAASTIGGLLLAMWIAENRGIPLLVGRQVAREVEWTNADRLSRDDLSRVVLIDDVLTTGVTLRPSLAALEKIGADPIAIGVAIDRSAGDVTARDEGQNVEIFSLVKISLSQWDESTCPICPTSKPLVDLSNSEEDYLSVVLSMPSEMAELITEGYRRVYLLQGDDEQVQALDALRPWVPSLLSGLPKWRVGEDSGLVQFIRGVTAFADNQVHRRVLVELVGHLLALTNIRVESRSLGCAVVVGDPAQIGNFFSSDSPLRPPPAADLANWSAFVPYFDALLETDNVFLFDRSGTLFAIKHLARITESHQSRGTQLLREVTAHADAVSMLVRRERKAAYVYREGRLANVAELSERTGVWEFSTPGPIVADIENELPGISHTLEAVLEVCREMSTRGYGGLFVVGDRSPTLAHGTNKVRVVSQQLHFVGTREAAEIAKLDGAVLVSRNGTIEQVSVIIRNAELDRLTATPTASRRRGGARSQAAHLTSLECPNAAVVLVSQNGTIEVHVRGQSFPVAKAIKGVL